MNTLANGEVEAAYKRFFPMILAKCTRMLSDSEEAHDVAQETFTRLWAKRSAIADGQMVTAWLYRTGTRLAIDRLRSRARQEPTECLDGPPSHGPSFDARIDARRTIVRLCRRTPTRELEAAVLNGVDGLTHAEIAEVMGKSERTVRRLLAKFHKRHSKSREDVHG